MQMEVRQPRHPVFRTEEDVVEEFCEFLRERIRIGVEVLREEVPDAHWPRIAARLDAAGIQHTPAASQPPTVTRIR